MAVNPTVYIGFCMGTGLLSRIIEWFTKGGPSHAFLLYRSTNFDGWVALGEEAGGWVTLPAEAMGNVCGLYELPTVDLWVGLRKNREWLGSGYAFGELFGMGFVMICWNWLKLKVKNPIDNANSWYCSGIIQKVLQDSGVKDLELDPSVTDPRRLREEIVARGGIEKNFSVVITSET